ncbi:MAG: 3'-5' exonuclease domain-containing protein 2 [Muribaculaceae bacterium]|nr:3'-5' exonuclease domain-containing protein 2 [Muribaculaceae bacterium]
MVKLSIDKKIVTSFEPICFDGVIYVVDTIDKLERAIEYLRNYKYIGIDTETRPSFKRGVNHNVALVQLSTIDTCFLVRINELGFNKILIDFLEDENICKIGLSLSDDITRLHKLYNFKPANFLDLQKFVKSYGILDNGLQRIFAIIFDRKISKGQQLTNWEINELTQKQKEYASTDAWACLAIYNELISGRFKPNESKYLINIENDEKKI